MQITTAYTGFHHLIFCSCFKSVNNQQSNRVLSTALDAVTKLFAEGNA